MIKTTLIVVAAILPPLAWFGGYLNLDYELMEVSKRAARRTFRHNLIRYGGFWAWVFYVVALVLIFSGLGSTLINMIPTTHGG